MQINLLRHFSITVRFVSGYFYFDMETPSMNCMLGRGFLPGTGWLGFNPNHGILIGNTHIAVASSAPRKHHAYYGGIRGSATSQLITNLSKEKRR
ncbi:MULTISPECIES: hypothetical protein [unclassified Pseudoalteromonas]|uniref:hypothetical protein n=1 Tax=unclassified Pseudoalteromonas TaxID=194690 RepID=UPI00160338FF|nr:MULTISPECIES: hypothetical protein [unclassified Pseudoalteromonas]MBB1334338.1 hypothetical protein [Pseudoalteromonas sp. SR41-6]MBB1459950.1 hypothetical protein [Pseudoalteromonas sp. SG41-8]